MKKTLSMLAIMSAVLVSCTKSEISQDGGNPESTYLNVYYDDIVFPSKGGEDDFDIESNTDWTISNNSDWLTIEPTEGNGNASITLTASASDVYDDRNTVITVKAGDKTETFTVTQKYAEALLVTKNKFDIPQEGGDFTIEIQSNISYEIQIDSDSQSWISEAPQSKALTAYTHTFSVKSNPNTTKRDGSLEIIGSNGKTETVNIYQAQMDELVLSKSEETVPAKGGEVRVQLRSNVDYEIIMPKNTDWVEQIQSDKTDELVFNVKPNDKTEDRETVITVKDKTSDLSQTFTIKQIVGSIILEDSYFEVDAKGGSVEVNLSTDIDFEVIIPENIDWVTRIETKSLEKRTFNLNVQPNSLTEEREAEITVKDVNSDVAQALTIKQKVGKIIVEQNEFEVQFKGETISIPYSSDIECKVVIPESAQSWISVVETKSIESHSVQLSIAFNEAESERTATVTIQDVNSPLSQDIMITQMAYGYYKGDIRATSEEDLKEICDAGYTIIDGDVYFSVKALSLLDNLIEEIKGDLQLGSACTTLDGLYGLKKVGGNLIYSGSALKSFEGLNNLESIGENLEVNTYSDGDITLKPLRKLETIGGNVILSNIDNFEGPENLSQIGDSLILNKMGSCQGLTGIRSLKNLKAVQIYSFEGLNNLTTISGDLYCRSCFITDFSGLNNLQTIGGNFTLKAVGSFNELKSFTGLNHLQEIMGDFFIDANTVYSIGPSGYNSRALYSLENFIGLESLQTINGDFKIYADYNQGTSYGSILRKLNSFEGLSELTIIGGDFKIKSGCDDFLTNLQSFEGLDNLEKVYGDFDAIIDDGYGNHNEIKFSEGPKKLSLIGGNFIIGKNRSYAPYEYTTMEGFSGLETVNGYMSLNNVESYLGLDNLKNIKGGLHITNGDTQGMSNLVAIGGSLSVTGELSSINGLVSLTTINGNLSISETDMSTISGINQLQTINGDIEISNNSVLKNISGFNCLTNCANISITDNSKLEDISGLSGLTNCTNISITDSPNLYNFESLETAAQNMTGAWYVYGCGYNPTKYQMLNGESKPQE